MGTLGAFILAMVVLTAIWPEKTGREAREIWTGIKRGWQTNDKE